MTRLVALLHKVVEVLLTCCTGIGISRLVLISSMAALLAPLWSIATFSGMPLAFMAFMAFSKNRRAAALPGLAVNKKVNRLAFLVHGPVEVFPDALDVTADTFST